jgi:hypothetical protein
MAVLTVLNGMLIGTYVYSQYSTTCRYFILFGSVEIEFLPSERTKQSFAKKAQEHQAAYCCQLSSPYCAHCAQTGQPVRTDAQTDQ